MASANGVAAAHTKRRKEESEVVDANRRHHKNPVNTHKQRIIIVDAMFRLFVQKLYENSSIAARQVRRRFYPLFI